MNLFNIMREILKELPRSHTYNEVIFELHLVNNVDTKKITGPQCIL